MKSRAINRDRQAARDLRRSMRLLESQGYTCFLAAGRGSPWSIIGVKAESVALVSVCHYLLDSHHAVTIRALACPPNVHKIVHTWDAKALKPEVTEL